MSRGWFSPWRRRSVLAFRRSWTIAISKAGRHAPPARFLHQVPGSDRRNQSAEAPLIVRKLRFDSRLVYDRPYFSNFCAAKFIDRILGEGNSLADYVEAEERSLWRAVEAQPARYIRWIRNQHPDVEVKIRNFIKVFLQHLEIT